MIYKHKITTIGSFHLNHCEDYVVCEDIGQSRFLIAALDGCTLGDESYFASALYGRILRKISKEEYYKEFVEVSKSSVSDQIKRVFFRLFEEIQLAKNLLQLNRNELLSTALIGILDYDKRQGEIICVGDGIVCIDGRLTEFDQENQPDYLAYHLDEDFEDWYDKINQRITLSTFEDISLCTDGLLTFVDKESNKTNDEKILEIINHLIQDESDLQNENMFFKKLNQINNHWKMIHTDDLGIVRVVIE